mgnify:CR=1 FL=1
MERRALNCLKWGISYRKKPAPSVSSPLKYPSLYPQTSIRKSPICLFLRSCRECSPVYRMAVMPEDEIPRYQEYAWAWFSGQDTEGYPAYFPRVRMIAPGVQQGPLQVFFRADCGNREALPLLSGTADCGHCQYQSDAKDDSEALCDQRVLEHCGGGTARYYGELLIGMGAGEFHPLASRPCGIRGCTPDRSGGRDRPPLPAYAHDSTWRTAGSNMAGSYRDMKIRIRRIRDFKRVPGKIGVVTLCPAASPTAPARRSVRPGDHQNRVHQPADIGRGAPADGC